MFTGLVEQVGEVLELRTSSTGAKLRVKADFEGIQLGESISVNGACLTVVEAKNNSLDFDVSKETLLRTNLKSLRRGDFVNLERAMPVGGRFGGHMVLGHVDFTSPIKSFSNFGEHRELVLSIPDEAEVYIVEKGSITLDGISLTVNYVKNGEISINVIPHTYENTNLKYKGVGDTVNVELDIIGKYVVNYLKGFRESTKEDKLREFFGL